MESENLIKYQQELLKLKEIYSLKPNLDYDEFTKQFNFGVIDEIMKKHYIEPKYQQLLGRNLLSPESKLNRILFNHNVGSGKTILAILIIMEYIKYYKKRYELREKGEIIKHGYAWIIGFSMTQFVRALISIPNFGFVTSEEAEKFYRLENLSLSGSVNDINEYKIFKTTLKRRLSTKSGQGFIRFIGYKKLYNMLFETRGNKQVDLTKMTEDELTKELASEKGSVKINESILNIFEDGIIICDEIQEVYNALAINNWGIALKTIINKWNNKVAFLTATPINNSPTEVIDMLNLLLPANEQLKKQDFFKNNRDLKDGALEKIGKLSVGRISHINVYNEEAYPKEIKHGKYITKLIDDHFKEIDQSLEYKETISYIKFVECPMSDLHQKIYDNYFRGMLAIEEYSLEDLVFPLEEEGLFGSQDIKSKIQALSLVKKKQYRIDIQDDHIIGDFLLKSNIGKYSSKYHTMLDILHSISQLPVEYLSSSEDEERTASYLNDSIMSGGGKIFIFHPKIKTSGTDLIASILKINGYISYGSTPNDNTLCSLCGVPRCQHDNKRTKYKHNYFPSTFVQYTGEYDANKLAIIRDQFNVMSNIDGRIIKIFIGSKISYSKITLKGVQYFINLGLVDDIPSFLQLTGRIIRYLSHIALPEKHRVCHTYNLVTSTQNKFFSIEEFKYLEKIKDYKVIQQIESVLHRYAIDASVNIDINQPPDSVKSDPKREHDIGDLYYTPATTIKFKLSEINTTYFDIYHKDEEVEIIIKLIKILFINMSQIWTYDDLWSTIKKSPINTQFNPALFDEKSFVIALNRLVWNRNSKYINVYDESKELQPIEQIMDPLNSIIPFNNMNTKIVNIDKYYILFPINEYNEPDLTSQAFIQEIKEQRIGVLEYIKTKTNIFDYSTKKYKFFQKYKDSQFSQLTESLNEYNKEFHINFIRETIEYIFNIWTDPFYDGSEYHDFYFKMLYYYNTMGIIIFASFINNIKDIQTKYESFILESGRKIKSTFDTIAESSLKAMLESDINTTTKMVEYINKSKEFNLKKEGHTKTIRVPSDMLPIGYFIDIPTFYYPSSGWIEIPEYLNSIETTGYVENDIIIGIFEKSQTGLDIKFKIRKPIHKIKIHKDKRLIERGLVCKTIPKEKLFKIMKQLNIMSEERISIGSICELIKTKLCHLELDERRKVPRSNIKYIYFYFEKVPEIG